MTRRRRSYREEGDGLYQEERDLKVAVPDSIAIPTIIWDAVPNCSVHCQAYNICSVKDKDPHMPCQPQLDYIDKIYQAITRAYGKRLSDGTLIRIGMHLIPLYRLLIRLKIYELGLDKVDVETAKGGTTINPVFRELRELIIRIDRIWKDIGIGEIGEGLDPGGFTEGMEEDGWTPMERDSEGKPVSSIKGGG